MDDLPKLNFQDLKPWFDKTEMLIACAEQVQKDLSIYGIKLAIRNDTHNIYNELFSQLEPEIANLMGKPSSIMEILYRVDVDENKMKMVEIVNEPFSHTLTRLILWRELQKVVTRFLLKNQR